MGDRSCRDIEVYIGFQTSEIKTRYEEYHFCDEERIWDNNFFFDKLVEMR